MEKLIFKPGIKTPYVILDTEMSLFEISGKSIPENAIEFYHPILKWIEKYSESPNNVTKFKVKLEYFNTSSSKIILEILRKIADIQNSDVVVEWYYEEGDEEIQSAGEDYREVLSVPFKMIPIVDNQEGSTALDEKLNMFQSELNVLKKAQSVDKKKSLSKEELSSEFQNLAKSYKFLLDDVKVLTSVSDRLQNKLNSANETLKKQSDEIQNINANLETKNTKLQLTIDELTKARASRSAITIVLIITVVLFFISETLEIPLENYLNGATDYPIVWGFGLKLIIALLIKPIESVVESTLLKRARKREAAALATANK